jgi:NAD(P)-dependent dehydrogenase (short-subunit alcohol dehydrogenase family)
VSPAAAKPFQGRAAVVTGAGRGIGRAIALGLAQSGARVALLARSQEQLDEVASVIHANGGLPFVVRADVGDRGSAEDAAKAVLTEFGTADILVNNAGVAWPLASTASISITEWAAAIDINLVGAVNLTIALLPAMVAQGWGRIINVSSGAAARPAAMVRGNAYVTSKAALEAHTLNLAAELVGTGVTVNAYRPGSVDTEMQGWIRRQSPDDVGARLHAAFIENYKKGALTDPRDSAQSLLERIPSDTTGEIWSFGDP